MRRDIISNGLAMMEFCAVQDDLSYRRGVDKLRKQLTDDAASLAQFREAVMVSLPIIRARLNAVEEAFTDA